MMQSQGYLYVCVCVCVMMLFQTESRQKKNDGLSCVCVCVILFCVVFFFSLEFTSCCICCCVNCVCVCVCVPEPSLWFLGVIFFYQWHNLDRWRTVRLMNFLQWRYWCQSQCWLQYVRNFFFLCGVRVCVCVVQKKKNNGFLVSKSKGLKNAKKQTHTAKLHTNTHTHTQIYIYFFLPSDLHMLLSVDVVARVCECGVGNDVVVGANWVRPTLNDVFAKKKTKMGNITTWITVTIMYQIKKKSCGGKSLFLFFFFAELVLACVCVMGCDPWGGRRAGGLILFKIKE